MSDRTYYQLKEKNKDKSIQKTYVDTPTGVQYVMIVGGEGDYYDR